MHTAFASPSSIAPLAALMPGLPGHGMPQERLARIAARRAFVEMKLRFMQALEGLDGARADWVREHVRRANQPVDLWLLRRSVFEAVARSRHDGQRLCAELDQALDSVLPEPATEQMTLG